MIPGEPPLNQNGVLRVNPWSTYVLALIVTGNTAPPQKDLDSNVENSGPRSVQRLSGGMGRDPVLCSLGNQKVIQVTLTQFRLQSAEVGFRVRNRWRPWLEHAAVQAGLSRGGYEG